MKKKIIANLLLFGLMLSLTVSCSPANDTVRESGNSSAFNGSNGASAESGSTPIGYTDAISSGNMQKNVPSGNFVSIGDEVIFTQVDNATGSVNLLSYNRTTKAVTSFCKDATCTHSADSCVTGGVESNLEWYNGEVYGRSSSNAGSVLQLKNGRFETQIDGGVAHFFHYGENLYAATADASLVVFEKGRKEPKVLLDEYTGYWETVCDGYLYYEYSGFHRLKLGEENAKPETLITDADCITDGKHIYYAKYDDPKLYRCEMDGSNPESLTDKPVLPASWNFDDDYFYFRYYTGGDISGDDSHDIYRLLKSDPAQIEKLAELPVPAYQIFTGSDSEDIFVTSWGEIQDVYVISESVTEVKKLYGEQLL